MTDQNQPPDWELLPANPRGFFALPAEFERKELKRAYNRLIRIYKPEKHPAEFQRIRAAFEQLDMQLRYGYSPEIESQRRPDYDWDERSISRNPSDVSAEQGANTVPSPPHLELHERLEQESPSALYQELAEKAGKDPYVYYALALLSDVVNRKDPLQFARWLLKGLSEYPSEHGLLHLMRDYLREQSPSPKLVKLLVACSKAVPTDNFYPLTEPAWENLLREENFDRCIAALKECQANLRDIGINGQLVFMIRMLRFALWRDQSEWKDRALEFVEENYEQIPSHLEFEVELLSAAHQYLANRDQFLNGDPLRQQIDEAMESYFTLSQVEGDQRVVQCQLGMLDNTEQLLAAFPPEDSSDEYQTMYTLWDWLSFDVGERYGVEREDDVNTNMWLGRCSALLKQCRARTKGSAGGWLWDFLGIFAVLAKGAIYFFVPALLCGVLAAISESLFPNRDEGISVLVIVLVGVIVGLYAGHRLAKLFMSRIWESYCERQARRNYDHYWRREVLDFLDRSQLNFHMTTQMMAHSASEDLDTWVCHFIQQDYALAIFATARRFLV